MGIHQEEKLYLSTKGLLEIVRNAFQKVKETKKHRDGASLVDCLMSGLAVFQMKIPSLLSYDNTKETTLVKHNLSTLFGVNFAPSDSYIRERLDKVEPRELRRSFKDVFRATQRGKILEPFIFLANRYLMLVDASGFFSSNEVRCEGCCEKRHSNGEITYYHQILAAALVHPDHKEVFPFCPEPIIKQDGRVKNDCETNASYRLLEDFKREHPHLKVIVSGDAIYSSGPFISKLKELDMQYIIGIKPQGNKSLFDWVTGIELENYKMVKDGTTYEFSWVNGVPLNDTYPDLLVNFLDCKIDDPKTEKKHFSWVTDITLCKENVFEISRGGRARWKIENETFNTLKNQGYNFEHNYGHGYENLSTVFAMLMMLAFYIDQVQQKACGLFQGALTFCKSKKALWEKMRSLFTEYYIDNWVDLFYAMRPNSARPHLPPKPP
jgi:hypothetical protein